MASAAASSALVLCLPAAAQISRARRRGGVMGHLGHFRQVVRKDVEYLKGSVSKGIEWANGALRLPEVSRSISDVIWFRNVEDQGAAGLKAPAFPQPYYPELSSVDLLMADLKALEAYAKYFYCRIKVLSKPLPDVYDPDEVTEYFSYRPHVVAFRLLEVFAYFALAGIRLRISKIGEHELAQDQEIDWNISQYNFGLVLKETLLNLGPTFIKVGQSLSTRPDIIGKEIATALSELHDQIPPFPRTEALKIIEEELGSSAQSLFSYISEEPIAAASFGQVYRASTIDGSNVAVKVQRPNLKHVVVRDIYILRLGLGIAQRVLKREYDPRVYADELGRGFVGELDYRLEADNAIYFKEAHSRFPFISVPKIYRNLSTRRVLTMEWIVGESPKDLLFQVTGDTYDNRSEMQLLDARRRLLDLVKIGVEAALIQLLETGVLHADPHPGNLRYTSTGQIGFLDFGLICRMQRKHQLAMLASTLHIVYGDWAALVYALKDMDVVRPGVNLNRVIMDLEDAIGEVEIKDGIPIVKFSRVIGKVWSVAFKYNFRMPAYYALVLRSLASFEGLAAAADPNFQTFEAAYPYVVRKLLTDNSVATRRILHSVVFNKRKEFRWERLALFLRVGTTSLQQLVLSKGDSSILASSNKKKASVFDAANLVLLLLSSNDGAVLRRLIMTADGASLIRAVVSKEAAPYRQHFSKVIADVLYQWTIKRFSSGLAASQYAPLTRLSDELNRIQAMLSYKQSMPVQDYALILRDRRIKVIVSRILNSAKTDPLLMIRLCWVSFIMLATASALASHRVLMTLSEASIGKVPVSPKRVAVPV
uniref:Protein kinase domain-containing protein n=1 Tax=Kalanchoe fedtschenkoi TaxID=63787 RepID=A0A7N0V8P3_KALFE